MKKLLLIIVLLLVVFLSSCSKSSDGTTTIKTSDKVEYEIIELTRDNLYKYVTYYVSNTAPVSTDTSRTYYNFYGAEGCRFENCVIKYSGTVNGTLELSISGDGQVIIYRNASGYINIDEVSGTVKVPKI